ncbi:hypothetical protein [Lutibacter sp.]|uniref:hypothetical protein n=1 Tax=Lutibacter sp. TaxID=1925666 RepID=UPI003564660E
MKVTSLKQTDRAPYLKVVNNSMGKKINSSEKINRIYINTLMPCFNYVNQAGEVVSPEKCILL